VEPIVKRVLLFLAVLCALVAVAGAGFAQQPTAPTKKPAAKGKGAAKKPAPKPPEDEVLKLLPKPKPAIDQPLACSDPTRTFVDVVAIRKNRPELVVNYLWKTHAKASIEVRLLGEDDPATYESEADPDTSEVRPLGFVARIMKPEVMLALHKCGDREEEMSVSKTFTTPILKTKDDLDSEFSVVGDKNGMGRSAGKAVFAPSTDSVDPMPRVVFYPLEPWSVDVETLRLELPREHFAKPGRVRVWFMRDGSIVWWQTVKWPGLDASAADKPGEKPAVK
jgi:hypothetical protein